MMTITIGTRGSKLALWQAHYVANRLQQGGVTTKLVPITTQGDKRQEVGIADIGAQGVFTAEIEDQLQQGTIDIAVHSAKDLQSELSAVLRSLHSPSASGVNDVLVSHQPLTELTPASSWTIGTSRPAGKRCCTTTIRP